MAGSHIDITELKQTQEALAKREHQLQTVLDALPVGVWFTDRAGKPLLANPAAKQIWSNIKQIGLQTENPQAGWWETIGPVNEPHRWALSHVLATGVPSLNETFDLECLDGTKKTIRNSTVPVNDNDGVVLGAIVLSEDITLLRQAQAALQLTQFSVDHAVEGFLWIGSDARIFHVNNSICRMLEYTWEELTAMTLYDIDPNLSSKVWPAHWEELKEKGSLTFESKYWSRTGHVLDLEVTVNYLQYEGKEYNCAIMRDIGERKWVEEALRASEERYRSLYDETPTMYFTLATDGTVLSVNRFGAEQLGYQTEELVGHSVLGLFHEDDKEGVVASLSECLATPEITRYWEFRKLRKDRSIIWVRETARVGQSSTAETVVLVTCEDVTVRKRAEHESHERILQATAIQAALLELAHLDDTRLTFSEVLPQVTRIVADMLAVDRVSLWLLSEDQTELVCQNLYLRGQAIHSAGSRLPASRYPRYCAVLKESLVVAASDARIDQRTSEFTDDYFLSLGITSVLDVPIRRQGRVVGVLWCEHVGAPRKWTHEAQDFASSAGQTIVRMMEAVERKQAEEELQKSHAFLRQVIDIDPNFIFAKDREGRFVLVNKALTDTYGTTVDELIGKTDAHFNPNREEVAFFREKDLAIMNNLKDLFIPEEMITDSVGRIRWLQTVKRPIFDDEGRATMVLSASTDITERKGMEETLRQRERALRTAIEERERISQDLHDGILQSLFAVGLALESAKLTMSPRNLKMSRASLNQAIDQLNEVMREIRNFIAGLGSDLLQGKDLPAALKKMLITLTEHQPTRVRLAVEDRAVKAVSEEQSLHLFLVIQEAVSNCIKHGHAQEARVSLKMLKQGLRLSIRDNGRGFKQDAAKRTGHGLANMAARAQKLGGRFTVLSKINEGTSVVLDLPNEAADVSR
jgi:PAS domain S-box-containing protein